MARKYSKYNELLWSSNR